MKERDVRTAFAVLTLLGAFGCGVDPVRLASTPVRAPSEVEQPPDVEPEKTGPSSPVPDLATPANISCVSEASTRPGELVPHVWRATATFNGDAATTTVTRGRQLAALDPSQVAGAPIAARTEELDVTIDADLLSLMGSEMAIIVEGDGSFFQGSLELAGGEPRQDLACWDQSTIFGSPWGGVAGTLTAHFDWTTGDCLDASGATATNALPVEFVRETGFGECADLAGAQLNGDDLSGTSQLQYTWLAGAKLGGASLFYANLTHASLFGADLEGLEFGHATVGGSVDANTVLPTDGCRLTESPWAGSSVSCER